MTLAFLPALTAHWPLDRLRPYARKALTQSSFSACLPGSKGLLREADDLIRRGDVLVAGMG